MKTLIKNILLAVPVILSASCSSWLEEEPKTFISPSAFYQTVEDFDGALKGLYPQDQNLNLAEVLPIIMTSLSRQNRLAIFGQTIRDMVFMHSEVLGPDLTVRLKIPI